MQQVDAADELDGRAICGAGDLERSADHPGNREQKDRPVPEHLLDRGREIALPAGGQLVDQPPRDERIVSQQLKGPCQLRGRRLVTGEDHRHERVANVLDARLIAGPRFIAGRWLAIQEHGEQAAIPGAAVRAALDQPHEDLIDPGALDEKAPPDASPSRQAPELGLLQCQARRYREHREQSCMKLAHGGVLTAEERLQNHPQRECPQVWVTRERDAARPRGDFARRYLPHHLGVLVHDSMMKRGQYRPPAGKMRLFLG